MRHELDFSQEIPIGDVTQRHVTFSFSVESRDNIWKVATTLSQLSFL